MTAAKQAFAPTSAARRRWAELLLGFVCIFGGLSLPLPGLAQLWVGTHAAIGNALLPGSLASGVELAFRGSSTATDSSSWLLTLLVQPLPPAAVITAPIDLRTLAFLPTACFVALALATPLPSRQHNLKLLGKGLLILQPLLLGLMALPVLAFLGGTGPVRAFDLGIATDTVVQILYRALVASPGMAYVIPLFLWWILSIRISKAVSGIRSQPRATRE